MKLFWASSFQNSKVIHNYDNNLIKMAQVVKPCEIYIFSKSSRDCSIGIELRNWISRIGIGC